MSIPYIKWIEPDCLCSLSFLFLNLDVDTDSSKYDYNINYDRYCIEDIQRKRGTTGCYIIRKIIEKWC